MLNSLLPPSVELFAADSRLALEVLEEVLLVCDLLEKESLRCGGGGGGDGLGFSSSSAVGRVTPLTVVSSPLS